MHGCRCILLAMAVSQTFGCTTASSDYFSATPSFLRGNPSEVREQLLTHIPIGTPHKDAERLVKSLGLELTPQSELGSEAIDAIECRHTGPNGPFGQTTWLIRIDCPDGKVTDILCESIGVSNW
jgi:hypothetical protein